MSDLDGGGGDHLSIGEVLAALNDEFPDITISKIRFLESQGLIDPERTPSGYRKFAPDDLVRLRWILFQQKEHFLPLKVIKERLEQLGPEELARLDAEPEPEAVAEGGPERAEPPERPVVSDPMVSPAEVPVPAPPTAAPPPRRRPGARTGAPTFAPTLPLDDGDDDAQIGASTGDVEQLYTRDALASAAGLRREQLASLEEYGLVTPARETGAEVQFDVEALETATIAAGFFARGIEARHLRMYRTFAEREAVLYGQVLLPYLRQRNPDSRARLQDELVELSRLGRRLRGVLLREAVRDALSE